MKFTPGGTKNSITPGSKPDTSATMKFKPSGPKIPVKPGSESESSATMKFTPGGTKNSITPGSRPESSATMKFKPGVAKGTQQIKTAYKLPLDHKAGPGNSTVLAKTQGDDVLHQVNSARAHMHGVNIRPVPPGKVSVHKDGGLSIAASGGRTYKLRPDGTLASFSAHNHTAQFFPHGGIRTLHTKTLDITRGVHGERRIMTVRPDKSVLVATGPHHGYLQRTVTWHNRTFYQRTYVMNRVTYTRVYNSYTYRGIVLEEYVPTMYYAPAFYQWAYTPWGVPVNYAWGWNGDPWYGYYAGYFAPLPVYPTPSLWLADYVIGETLRAAYVAQMENNEQPPAEYAQDETAMPAEYAEADTPITPEIRQTIADEVRLQLAQEEEAAAQSNQATSNVEPPSMLSNPQYPFVVVSNLAVVTSSGEECALSAGDVLRLNGAPLEGAQAAEVRVVSTRRADCSANSVVTVAFNDLQEMDNSMREQIYSGLNTLRTSQGSNGLPGAPTNALTTQQNREVAGMPPADDNVADMLESQQNEADQAESQTMDSAFGEQNHASN